MGNRSSPLSDCPVDLMTLNSRKSLLGPETTVEIRSGPEKINKRGFLASSAGCTLDVLSVAYTCKGRFKLCKKQGTVRGRGN